MKSSARAFRDNPHRAVTLLGMSGVGKTRLSQMLAKSGWFHYSGDYRIGSHYLDEHILDEVKHRMMGDPFLRELLRSSAIKIQNGVTITNLGFASSFLSKLGDPDKGGLPLREFKRRQRLHREAEIAAMRDVPHFIDRARAMYGFSHFVNDAGGSLCELDDPALLDMLARHTVFLYIQATPEDEQALIDRAVSDPKPLYYREAFLDEHLALYRNEHDVDYAALIDPQNFGRWVFPRLFRARIPRYESIADQYGYTVSATDIGALRDEADFLDLMDRVLTA